MPIKFNMPSTSDVKNQIYQKIKVKIEKALEPISSKIPEAIIIISDTNGKINIKIQNVPEEFLSQAESLIRQAQE